MPDATDPRAWVARASAEWDHHLGRSEPLERLVAYAVQVRYPGEDPSVAEAKRRCRLPGLCVDSPESCWSRADANCCILTRLRVMLGGQAKDPTVQRMLERLRHTGWAHSSRPRGKMSSG
jgi:hypothetical protein